MYEVGVGESPMSIAGALSGDCNRYGELLAANPHKPLVRVRGVLTFEALAVGERLNLPHGWHHHHHPMHGRFSPLPDGYLGDGSGDTLGTNQGLHVGESITSPDGNVSLTLQQDGDLVIQTKDGTVLWRSGTAGKGGVIAWMNADGNFRVEAPGGESHKLWDNGARGHKDARARIENTGNLYVWDGTHHMIWDAGATIGHPNPVPGGHGAAHTDFGGIDHDLNRLAHDLDHFAKDLVKDVKQFGPMLLSEVQGLISLIPGIGTGISAAIGLAMALLEGGSPLEIAIRTAYGAIPIPPGIRNVTDPIVDGAIHFAEHPKDFTDAAITTVRDAVPSGLPREVFDTLIKIIVKHQPIMKAVGGLVTDVAQQVPGVQNVIAAIPNKGQVFQSIKQIAPNLQVLPAQIPQLVQQAQSLAPNSPLNPAQAAAIVQHAQQRVLPLHAYAAAQEMVHAAHQLGGPAAAAAALAHLSPPPIAAVVPAAVPAVASLLPSAPPPPAVPIPPPPPPPSAAITALPPAPPTPPSAAVTAYPPHPAAIPYPPHPAPRPYAPPRVTGRSATGTRVYPPYVHHGYPPHPGPRSHGVHGAPGSVGECAPDCRRWGEPVEMDHGMAQVANMLLTARRTNAAISTGPDGVTYKFERSDAGITARPCLG